jgi:nicotinamidase-related amidase
MQDLGILLIDMQEYFIDLLSGPRHSEETKKLIQTQKRLLSFAKINKIPVFVLEYKGFGKTIDEVEESLRGNESYSVEKVRENGFTTKMEPDRAGLIGKIWENKELIKGLKKKRIKKLIITGVYKTSCVLKTASGAKRRGYEVFTSEDLMNFEYLKEPWFYNHSNHYEKLDDLLLSVAQ